MLSSDCPEIFVPVCSLLHRAFPDGSASLELVAIIRVFIPEFSNRNLAIVIQYGFNISYDDGLDQVLRAGSGSDFISEDMAAEALRKLKMAGYDEWLEQYGEHLAD